MKHPPECTIEWIQPAGRWQERGADLACLRLACGLEPGSNLEPVIDAQGHTLWHYWAQGPAPHDLIAHMEPVEQDHYRNHVSLKGEHPLLRLAAGSRYEALQAWGNRYGTQHWPETRNRHGDNLVASAIWSGDENTALWAIANRTGNMDNQDVSGLSCLMVAVHRSTERVLEALLAAGADPVAVDHQGRSALHHAASRGLEDMFVLLEDAGCDPQEKDKSGSTAAALLARAAKSDTLAILSQHWQKRARSRLDF